MREDRLYKIVTNINYLMFRGGAGGEMLTSLIYKYSNTYKNNIESRYQDDINKTSINYHRLFAEITNLPQQNVSMSDLSARVLEEDIVEAESFLESNKNFLIRLHYINYRPILNRSYFLLLDDERWFDYAGLLVSFKNMFTKTEALNCLQSQDRKFGRELKEKELAMEKISEYMLKNNTDRISSIKLHLIHTNFSEIDEILETGILELYNKHKEFIHGKFDIYLNRMSAKPVKKIVNYSNIFKRGYLEEIFDISNPSFHEELVQWHAGNLKLLSENGIDAEIFKI